MENRIPQSPPVIEKLANEEGRPLWSVMIPTYNCYDYIEKAITSVLQQDMGVGNMQIEIIDDCSKDGNVKQLVAAVGKGRVLFFSQPNNRGSLRNFETCINRARGHYVHILHGDDFVLDGYYKEMTDLLTKFPEAGAAFTNFYYANYKSEIVNIVNEPMLATPGIIPDFLTKIAKRQLIQPPAMTVRRSTYEKVGSFFGAHFGEDWEMWVRIASQFPVAYSPKYLATYRVAHGIGISHGSFLTGQNILDISHIIDIIQNHLPAENQKTLKKAALSYYSIYCIRTANSLLYENRRAAMRQVKGALKMSRSMPTLFWATRFFLMDLLSYKHLEKIFRKKKS
jgi:glycosyltransferase involved in cell wall biosynthesis